MKLKLKDTVDMMNCDDYKERFVAEYLQVKIRYEKLKAMIDKYHAGVLEFTPTCPISLLEEQLGYMKNYISCLEERAKFEGIEDVSKM